MTIQFDLTDDQREVQELARRFTADRLTPNAAEWDEKHIFPREVIKEAAELGFAAIYVSEESGGIALGRLEAALIFEAMSYGDPRRRRSERQRHDQWSAGVRSQPGSHRLRQLAVRTPRAEDFEGVD